MLPSSGRQNLQRTAEGFPTVRSRVIIVPSSLFRLFFRLLIIEPNRTFVKADGRHKSLTKTWYLHKNMVFIAQSLAIDFFMWYYKFKAQVHKFTTHVCMYFYSIKNTCSILHTCFCENEFLSQQSELCVFRFTALAAHFLYRKR